jgi:hypothetical protein
MKNTQTIENGVQRGEVICSGAQSTTKECSASKECKLVILSEKLFCNTVEDTKMIETSSVS